MSSKDVGLRIRVERELREAFQEVCLTQNRHGSEVLREFMQTYVERHQQGQGDLFVTGQARRQSVQKRAGR